MPDQSLALDDSLGQSGQTLPAVHVKFFAPMANLVVSSAMRISHLAQTFGMLSDLQRIRREDEAKEIIGRHLFEVARTRYVCMVDTFAFIFRRLCQVTAILSSDFPGFAMPNIPHVPIGCGERLTDAKTGKIFQIWLSD
jgi:hypothetical protein